MTGSWAPWPTWVSGSRIQTVGNILRRHDIPPAPKRKQTTSWKDFIRAHVAVLVASDFFTVEVLALTGLITCHNEAHYHEERNHQGKDNVLLFPLPAQAVRGEREKVRCRERLGGLLKYYEREAA
jgi:hypothetical protein